MIDISERDFEKEVLECEQPVFACFTTQWCGHCFPTCLTADELESRYDGQLKFVRIDKEKAPEISDKYHITVVPSIIIFQDSQIIKKLLGYQDNLVLRDLLDSLLAGLSIGSADGVGMPSTDYGTPRRTTGMKSKNPGSPFDDLAKEYDAWYNGEGSTIFSNEVQAFKPLLPSLPKPWLEIGVGSGRFARALGIGAGVDPSIELVKMAGRRGIAAFLGRGERGPFGKESFGAVFLITTLCFLKHPPEVLGEASRILIPGGQLVLGLVLKESPWGQFYQKKRAQGHRFYKSATFYSYDEVVKLIEPAGFSTEKIVSTLFQGPGEVHHAEDPKEGYFPDAGFTIIVARNKAAKVGK